MVLLLGERLAFPGSIRYDARMEGNGRLRSAAIASGLPIRLGTASRPDGGGGEASRSLHRARAAGSEVLALSLVLLAFAGCRGSGEPDSLPVPAEPTFSAHVGEILYRACTPCHQEGGTGPFPLASYEDARPHAASIARVTAERRMPPWLPEPTDHPFAGERRLSEREIEILRRWAEGGAPQGDARRAPDPPGSTAGWVLGEPDLVLEMERPFRLDPSLHAPHAPHASSAPADVYRTFVMAVPVEETRYVRAVELLPGDASVVHHAIMSVDLTPSSRQEDARDPEPGFDGMFKATAAGAPGGFFLGWTPGQVPRWNPEGLAWPLEPGTDFVVQTHLRPGSDPAEVRLKVGFHFGDGPPARRPVVVYLLGKGIDIPPGQSDYVVEDSFELPVNVELLGLYPHAHYLARTMEAEAVLPDGSRRTLLRIPRWDFDWQDTYPFAEPLPLPAGTVLRKRYVYDNSADNANNPHDPPRRVTFGRSSTDEMAELWIQALPASDEDFDVLQAAATAKGLADHLEMWRHLVELNPRDALAHANLASVHDARGETEASIEHYRTALAMDPDLELAHHNLATILEERGDLDGALHHYREAVRAFPDYASAHNRVGNLLFYANDPEAAEVHYRRVLEIDPGRVEAHVNLGNLARERGRPAAALDHYRRAAGVAPRSADVRFNLVYNLILLGAPDEALKHLDEAARLAPGDLQSRLAAAWMLATHPERSMRRGEAALRIAEELSASLPGEHPRVLDVIAASYAAMGRFEQAAEVARRAYDLALGVGDEQLARDIQRRLDLYRRGLPFAGSG